MAEKHKEEVVKGYGKKVYDEMGEFLGLEEIGYHRKKKVNIIKDKRQYSVRIPKSFAEFLKLAETDVFEFHLIPEGPPDDIQWVLKGYLVRG